MMSRRLLSTIAVALSVAAFAPASASAASTSPGWTITSLATPTNFAPGTDTASYQVFVRNSGSAPAEGPVTITDRLPAGLKAATAGERVSSQAYYYDENEEEIFFPEDEAGNPLRVHAIRFPEKTGDYINLQGNVWYFPCTSNGAGTVVSCTYSHAPVRPGVSLVMTLGVEVPSAASEGEEAVNVATVTGGGAPPASTSETSTVNSGTPSYGLESLDFQAAALDGLTDTQAGDHPYETTVSYFLNNEVDSSEGGAQYGPVSHGGVTEETKDFVVDLPPGFVGNPQVVAKCTPQRVQAETCPPSTQIGVATTYIVGGALNGNRPFPTINPIYNVTPEPDEPADLQFNDTGRVINLAVNVSQETGYAVRVTVSGITRIAQIAGVSVTFFGDPQSNPDVFNQSTGAQPLGFLTNPVDCSAGPLTARVSTDSWERPGAWLANGSPDLADPNWKTAAATVYPSMTGCDMLQFNPSVSVVPDTTQADEPTGVTVGVHVPQGTGIPPALTTPELEDATVTLPAGMSISPSAADGLQACSDEQFAETSTEPAVCPDASVLGTVRISTPLLERPLEGQVFLGSPECDPCTAVDAADGRQLRILIQAAGSGVRIKKEGRIYANPSTGQLTAKFLDNPQLPFENLELHFKGGLRAGLATPQTCGPAAATADLTPWSSPITPDAISEDAFDVDWDGNGGACPASLPLAPSFSAGTSNPNAGQFSPFTLTFGREDREQDLAAIQVHTPPGLLGTLTGIPLCEAPQASLGTCGEGSRIGSMTVAAGPGAHPFYEQGQIYLTGPYEGAPFGLSIVVPTVAGPFNLGNVVVRARIDVDPDTAALTVTADPFPQIIDGIPLRLRSANVTIDRPGFIFNPTNCEQLHITATITGAQGAQAQVQAPFGVSGCAGLHFGPTFKASTSGRTSRADGASLDVRLTFPAGAQSNISHVKVELPKALPARLTTLQKACPAATFEANPAACPSGSLVGIARASTPILPVPLVGPAYFVSHGGEAFPSLIVVLQGYGVRIDLVGATFISKQGITSSTFENVPDVQVSSFELYLPEGPNSALAANGSLCKQKLIMPTTFTAQDGARLKQRTKLSVTGCAVKAKAKKRNPHKRAKARRAGGSASSNGGKR